VVAKPELSVLGKIPSEPDFVRGGNVGATGQRFFRWLGDAVAEQTMAGHRELLQQPMGFLVHTESGSALGVMVASRDRVGRSFPLVLMSEHAPRLSGAGYVRIPASADRWLQLGCARLTQHVANTSSLDALRSDLADLSVHPDFVSWSGVGSTNAGLDVPLDSPQVRARVDTHAEVWHQSLFGASDSWARAAYAYDTLGKAVRSSLRLISHMELTPQATCVVDCPITHAGDVFLWLRLVQACRREVIVPPSLFWTLPAPTHATSEATSGRLLVSLGPPPIELFGYLLGLHQKSAKFWPLRTDNPSLLAQARAAVAALQWEPLLQRSSAIGFHDSVCERYQGGGL
jgi:type VI secretion system ImpM family protein